MNAPTTLTAIAAHVGACGPRPLASVIAWIMRHEGCDRACADRLLADALRGDYVAARDTDAGLTIVAGDRPVRRQREAETGATEERPSSNAPQARSARRPRGAWGADGLTAAQREVLRFICDHVRQFGCSPALRGIGKHMGINSTNGVLDHLKALEHKGWISRREMKARGITILRRPGIDPADVDARLAQLDQEIAEREAERAALLATREAGRAA